MVVGHVAVDDGFLAGLCHHVRTPLNGILGSLELLIESDIPAEAKELARAAFQSAADLHRLFEHDLLEIRGQVVGPADQFVPVPKR